MITVYDYKLHWFLHSIVEKPGAIARSVAMSLGNQAILPLPLIQAVVS